MKQQNIEEAAEPHFYKLGAEPAIYDLGPSGRGVVYCTVPLIDHDGAMWAASEAHGMRAHGCHTSVVLRALNPAREGIVRVWQR
jgi:hypothetical protein